MLHAPAEYVVGYEHDSPDRRQTDAGTGLVSGRVPESGIFRVLCPQDFGELTGQSPAARTLGLVVPL
jgi:hypothetical protein